MSAMPLSRLPNIVDAAVAPAGAVRGVQQAAPPATIEVADTNSLVGRALAILAEETEAWQARRGANLSSESTR